MSNQEPEQHMRYQLDKLVAWVVDPYTKKKKQIVLHGSGTLLIEPVMRNTEHEDNRAKKFDGNQASVILQITEKSETVSHD